MPSQLGVQRLQQQPQQQPQQQVTQAQGTNPDMMQALVKVITDQILAPPPQMPQPPQQQGLSNLDAFAAVRNPQAMPYLMERAQAPAQAQFQQKQQMFEQAMKQRGDAMRYGVDLLQMQAMNQYRNKPRVSETTITVQGKPHRVRFTTDPMTGETLGTEDLGEAFVPPAFLPTPQGFIEQPRTGGQGEYVEAPGGGRAIPQPPAGVVQDIAAGTATLTGLENLRQAYKEIRDKNAGQSLTGQVGRTLIGETRLGGALAPDYAKYVADRRAALNAYIKSVTGAQFSVRELERYEAQYPEPFDPEDVAERKIRALADRATSDMQAKLRAFPGAAGAAPQGGEAAPSNPALEIFRKRFGRDPGATQ